jgi:hypothetical protein
MSDAIPFSPPEVMDDDIRRACGLLGLPENAFHGLDGNDPRQHVLKCMDTIDIAACPGSGKTTLLVAKLAILSDKWQCRTRGVCVLSHTNAARSKIEALLGNTSVGRRLLSYPHFIGTIHGFANEFLALPWLRAKGRKISMINDGVCQARRWRRLNYGSRHALESRMVDKSDIRITDTDCNWAKWNGACPVGPHTKTFGDVKDACLQTTLEGYYCYDDMFLWASDLLVKLPSTVEIIRNRFPILFIDEAQDNSEEQSALLHRIFMDEDARVIRQRFGDGNQAVFDHPEAVQAQTDGFPDDGIRKELPNSHRFGQRIATLADPLGLVPYHLEGWGPKEVLESGDVEGPHTVFLFGKDDCGKVLDAYAALLAETFSDAELRKNTFIAVGAVHKHHKDDHKPRHVCHYWPAYDPELTGREPTPKTFVQYVRAGLAKAQLMGEVYPAVDKTAEAVVRLAGMGGGDQPVQGRGYRHRQILELLSIHVSEKARYLELVAALALSSGSLTKTSWANEWFTRAREIAATIAGLPLSGQEVNEFLAWSHAFDDPPAAGGAPTCKDNVYRCTKGGKEVAIRAGSIHSVKGETHMATLVMETFWNDHNLQKIRPWLDGTQSGHSSSTNEQGRRLKLHYVAMTRPTHLLCLAMKRSTFEDDAGNLNQDMVAKLERRGWQVKFV